MIERFVTIIILETRAENALHLKLSLLGKGNNPVILTEINDATHLIQSQPVEIILINLEQFEYQTKKLVDDINQFQHFKAPAVIGYVSDEIKIKPSFFDLKLTDVWLSGSIQYIKEKVEIHKKIVYEKRRVYGVLSQLYPESIIADFHLKNYTEPTKIEQATILFMDFVNFSFKTRNLTPLRVVRKLTKYFNHFDEIIKRYELEKIKTIGDAYMVIAGVTEKNPNPAMRICLAALEIQSYMEGQRRVAEGFNRDFWQIRMGIHSGPLVAGIIGKSKFHFDVWGDSVNIASRTEHASRPNTILITENVKNQVDHHLLILPDQSLEIPKRGGKIELFELKSANFNNLSTLKKLLISCELEYCDFINARKFIIHQLKAMLPTKCVYHSVLHSIDVEKAVIRLAKLAGISKHEIILLRTAALLHDIGFIVQYDENEIYAVQFAELYLPDFGYSKNDIEIIKQCIQSTSFNVKPNNTLEELLCDADLDYLGRTDYYELATLLRTELHNFNRVFNEQEWIEFQLHFLENVHSYHSPAAINIRIDTKWNAFKN